MMKIAETMERKMRENTNRKKVKENKEKIIFSRCQTTDWRQHFKKEMHVF